VPYAHSIVGTSSCVLQYQPACGLKDEPTVSRNGIHFWPLLYMSMMIKGTNRHLVIDPILAFHKCLMLVLLWALLVVVYSNQNLLEEEPRM
jgi:hypothetical protein